MNPRSDRHRRAASGALAALVALASVAAMTMSASASVAVMGPSSGTPPAQARSAGGTAAAAPPGPAAPATAEQWLDRVRRAYQTCNFYSDTGAVSRSYVGSDGALRPRKPVTFETAFQRPGALRFAAAYAIDGQADPGGTILRLVGGHVEVWNRSPFGEGTTQPPSLPMAIIAAVANSSTAVVQVVPLLFWPTLDGEVRDTLALSNATLLPMESIGEHSCVRVHGAIRPSGSSTLWIDPGTSLLRRIEQTFTGYLSGTTVVDIAPSVDAFPGFGAFERGGLPPITESTGPRAAASAPSAQPAAPKESGDDPRARELLERVWNTYASCRSYRDTGEVRFASDTMAGRIDVRGSFATAFVRPDRWRFQVTEGTAGTADSGMSNVFGGAGEAGAARFGVRSAESTVKRTGQEVPVPPGIQVKSDVEAFRTGSLYSHGVLSQVLPLLVPDVLCDVRSLNGARCLRRIEGARRLADAVHDGTNCARVSGTLGDIEVLLWIDPATALVRGVELSPVHHADGRAGVGPTTVSMLFRPLLDVDVEPADVSMPSDR